MAEYEPGDENSEAVLCRRCGAWVGDTGLHDGWHQWER
jgi:hypothetical protein